MSDIGMMVMVLGAGFLLGGIFYGGLWWTVQRGLVSKHPAVWFFASFWLRLGMAMAGFYGIAHDDWKRMLLCVAGFILARFAITRLTDEHRHAH